MSSALLYASYGQWVHANYHEWTRSLFVKATRQECPGWTASRCFLERDASFGRSVLLLLFEQLSDDRVVAHRRTSSGEGSRLYRVQDSRQAQERDGDSHFSWLHLASLPRHGIAFQMYVRVYTCIRTKSTCWRSCEKESDKAPARLSSYPWRRQCYSYFILSMSNGGRHNECPVYARRTEGTWRLFIVACYACTIVLTNYARRCASSACLSHGNEPRKVPQTSCVLEHHLLDDPVAGDFQWRFSGTSGGKSMWFYGRILRRIQVSVCEFSDPNVKSSSPRLRIFPGGSASKLQKQIEQNSAKTAKSTEKRKKIAVTAGGRARSIRELR